VVQAFPVGLEFDIPLASFSTERAWAEDFAWMAREDGANTEVVFVLLKGSQSVRIDLLAPDDIHYREREWYTSGRFAVVGTRVTSVNAVEVTIEQKRVYHV
jgi:hypothetical protein